ncbi:hypothetical protein, partial [Lactococcus lactis]|uniref:hypothetical protein n=1 Tax=Lactococcus lactis TaxID=1358 RepID=UPI001F2F6C83
FTNKINYYILLIESIIKDELIKNIEREVYDVFKIHIIFKTNSPPDMWLNFGFNILRESPLQ